MNARDADGNTPLILASFYASPKVVELLLERGADANAVNKAGVTALARAATNYENVAWQRGLRFLLETQGDDGTWHVARRTFPFQPTMDSGFPLHRDSWISAAATSWAVLALTQVSPVGSASGKPVHARPTPPVLTLKNEPSGTDSPRSKPTR